MNTKTAINQFRKWYYRKPELESVYQRFLTRDLNALGLPDDFYPVMGTANHSLLYLILRAVKELSPLSVVEFGAGLSSILLSRMQQAGIFKGSILTLEHDPEWAERISSKVQHRVCVVPLSEQQHSDNSFLGYDLCKVDFPGKIDLLLIDGPPAWETKHSHARFSCLPAFSHLDPEGFMIIIDDAERSGEAALASCLSHLAIQQGHQISKRFVAANSCQAILACGKFKTAAYF